MSVRNRDPAVGRSGRGPEGRGAATDTFAERLCLLVLLALIPLRAVISESHTLEAPRMLRHIDVPEGALPATTFAIFVVVLAAAALLIVLRLRRSTNHSEAPSRYCWTGIELGAALLGVVMLISIFRAGQKHLALIGSLDFLGLLIYAVTLRQLLTRPWHLRLTLCVILAAGAMVVAKCAYQHWVETPETIRYFEEHRDELIRPAPESEATSPSGFLYDYEQRLRSGAVSGYFAHPNVLGSYLILIVATGLALLAMRCAGRSRGSLLVPGVITLAAVVALGASQSKGAMAGCAVAVLVFIAGILLRRVVSRMPRRTALLIWLAGLAMALSLVVLLNARPDALGKSMLFRHFYWRGAWKMVEDRGWLGIGAGNFGRQFTRYKDAACPEDVDDPHSWPVKAAVEWGGLGLAGMLLVFLGVTRRLCVNGHGVSVEATHAVRNPESGILEDRIVGPPPGSIILWTGGIGAIVFAWWACLVTGTTSGYAVLVLHLPALVWVIAFAAGSLESSGRAYADESPRLILPALIGGMLGFILHTGVDLAMFQGGAATTFFAMMSVALAARGGDVSFVQPANAATTALRSAPRGISGRSFVMGVGVILLISIAVVSALLISPTARLGGLLRHARSTESPARWDNYLASSGFHAYRDAADCYRLDSTALNELIEELTSRVAAVEHVETALPLTDALEARDRDNSVVWQHRATLFYQRFVLHRDPSDLRAAIAAMEQSIAAYPTSPNRRLIIAELYERLAASTDSSEARRAAAEQLALALKLDDQRIYISKPHRLSQDHRARIEERIAR